MSYAFRDAVARATRAGLNAAQSLDYAITAVGVRDWAGVSEPAKQPHDWSQYALAHANAHGFYRSNRHAGAAATIKAAGEHLIHLVKHHPHEANDYAHAMESSEKPAEQRRAVMKVKNKHIKSIDASLGPSFTIYKTLMEHVKRPSGPSPSRPRTRDDMSAGGLGGGSSSGMGMMPPRRDDAVPSVPATVGPKMGPPSSPTAGAQRQSFDADLTHEDLARAHERRTAYHQKRAEHWRAKKATAHTKRKAEHHEKLAAVHNKMASAMRAAVQSHDAQPSRHTRNLGRRKAMKPPSYDARLETPGDFAEHYANLAAYHEDIARHEGGEHHKAAAYHYGQAAKHYRASHYAGKEGDWAKARQYQGMGMQSAQHARAVENGPPTEDAAISPAHEAKGYKKLAHQHAQQANQHQEAAQKMMEAHGFQNQAGPQRSTPAIRAAREAARLHHEASEHYGNAAEHAKAGRAAQAEESRRLGDKAHHAASRIQYEVEEKKENFPGHRDHLHLEQMRQAVHRLREAASMPKGAVGKEADTHNSEAPAAFLKARAQYQKAAGHLAEKIPDVMVAAKQSPASTPGNRFTGKHKHVVKRK